jgi:uncharacterized protein HemY
MAIRKLLLIVSVALCILQISCVGVPMTRDNDSTIKILGYICIFVVLFLIYLLIKNFLNTRKKYKKYDKIQKS